MGIRLTQKSFGCCNDSPVNRKALVTRSLDVWPLERLFKETDHSPFLASPYHYTPNEGWCKHQPHNTEAQMIHNSNNLYNTGDCSAALGRGTCALSGIASSFPFVPFLSLHSSDVQQWQPAFVLSLREKVINLQGCVSQRYTKTCSRIDCVGRWINSCYLLPSLSISSSLPFRHKPTVSPIPFKCQKIHLFEENIRTFSTVIVCVRPRAREKSRRWLCAPLAGFGEEWATVIPSVCRWWIVARSWASELGQSPGSPGSHREKAARPNCSL